MASQVSSNYVATDTLAARINALHLAGEADKASFHSYTDALARAGLQSETVPSKSRSTLERLLIDQPTEGEELLDNALEQLYNLRRDASVLDASGEDEGDLFQGEESGSQQTEDKGRRLREEADATQWAASDPRIQETAEAGRNEARRLLEEARRQRAARDTRSEGTRPLEREEEAARPP